MGRLPSEQPLTSGFSSARSKGEIIRHHNDIAWRQDSATSWTCLASGASVATIVLRSQYELESSDAQVTGSHSSLASAESQFDAWRSWTALRAQGV